LPGFLAGDAKYAALAHAEAFCLPSHHEGFSVAVLEALSWGAPTVISSGCHFPELSSEGAGWVHSIGAAPLLQTLREVLGSPEQTRARAAFGQRWVRARFQWSALERLFHQWYKERCSGGSR
jgi:glycosyltransferase involved in cell wall biosynthesis